jgi:hypothetical protein
MIFAAHACEADGPVECTGTAIPFYAGRHCPPTRQLTTEKVWTMEKWPTSFAAISHTGSVKRKSDISTTTERPCVRFSQQFKR